MSKIISPVPIEIHINYNEVTGQAAYTISRSGQPVALLFPQLVSIFCSILQECIKQLAAAMNAAPPAPPRSSPPDTFKG